MPTYPFNARTNKKTVLINVLSAPIALPKDTALKVHKEKGAYGEVTTKIGTAIRGGAVLKTDYDQV